MDGFETTDAGMRGEMMVTFTLTRAAARMCWPCTTTCRLAFRQRTTKPAGGLDKLAAFVEVDKG